MNFREKRPLYILEELAAILRGENGCQWDRQQTSKSLRPYLIEEAYEVYDAIESGSPADLKEELGDLLYQVYAHSAIAAEEKSFTIDDVAHGIVEKLVRRHPHVFGDEKGMTADEVSVNWEKIKKGEKPHRESILDGVPVHLPSLLKAYRIQQKVSRAGFDWDRVDGAIEKIREEMEELKEAAAKGDHESVTDECGDVLFSIINVMRMMKVNPDEALNRTIGKFMKRFRLVEGMAAAKDRKVEDMTIGELDELWNIAKKSD